MDAQNLTLSEETSVGKMLGLSEEGFAKKRYSDETLERFTTLLNEAVEGDNRATFYLKEAMVTADFPYLFADVIDKALMAQWASTIPNWQAFVKTGTVRDFRQAKLLGIEGMGAVLDAVGERAEYPERGPTEETPIYRQVAKYGARFGISFETIINDDLSALRDLPQKLVVAARRTEALAVANLYCGSAGPDATLYSVGNSNIIPSNPALSVNGLAAGFLKMAGQTDIDGFPLMIDAYTLVVPRALEVTANNILNALQIEVGTGGGAYNASDQIVARNWLAGKLNVVVDDYIGLVASSNQTTSWFLFASTSAARPAMQVDYLVGHETPELFVKAPNASRVGGGTVPESFETDDQEYKVRHIFGATLIDPKATVASNGTGA